MKNKMLPNFLIIGAQKAGSTFFLRCLSEHPDVFMPPGEIRFFEDPEYLRSNIQDLEKLFRPVTHQKALGIKRPDYLSKLECPERIYQHVPEAKLVAILRHPVERAISAYFHLMKCGFIPVKPVEEGLTRIINGEYQTPYPKSAEIINYGLYHQHLSRYLAYFNKSQILALIFDDIKADSLKAIKQTYRFIGVDDAYVPTLLKTKRRESVNAGMYSLARLHVNNLRNPLMFRYNETNTKRYPKERPGVATRLINKMILSTDSLLLGRVWKGSKPELSPELTYCLGKIFQEDIERLEEFLGQALPAWKVQSTEPNS